MPSNHASSEKRIALTIQMPSVSLLRFMEKMLQDDKLFESAIESPLSAMKESGVRLDVSKFAPEDFATFFGAIAGAKELIKSKQIKDITFENIFGRSAEIRGTTILSETQKGMWTNFDKDAFAEKQMYTGAATEFETSKIGIDPRNIKNLLELARIKAEADPGEWTTSKGTDKGVTFHFDADKGVGSDTSKSTDTYSSKGGSSIFDPTLIDNILNGPLINPGELAAISAQIETYVQISEQE